MKPAAEPGSRSWGFHGIERAQPASAADEPPITTEKLMKKNSIARSMAPGSLSPDLLAAVDGGILNFDLGDKRITETVKGQENNSDNTWARDVGTNYAIKYAGNDPAAMETLLNQRDKNVKDSKPDVAPTYSVP